MRLQNYPYFTNEEIEKYRNPAAFPLGDDDREYNCLVYCEATGPNGKLPSIRRLPFTGNLAEPQGPGGEGEIRGSFVISKHLLLEAYLLPMFRVLSRAIQVIPLEPEMGLTDDKGEIFRPRFAFGSDPIDPQDKSRLPHSSANRGDPLDKFFDWTPRTDGPGYQWSDKVDAWGSGTATKDYEALGYKDGPFWRQWTIWSKMDVNISWVKGRSSLLVEGRTEYYHWEGYNRSSSKFGWGPDGCTFWGRYVTPCFCRMYTHHLRPRLTRTEQVRDPCDLELRNRFGCAR